MVTTRSYSYLLISTCKINSIKALSLINKLLIILPNLSNKSAILGRGRTSNLVFKYPLSTLNSLHIANYLAFFVEKSTGAP